MDYFVFISEQWLLVSTLLVLVYVYAWREKAKAGQPLSASLVTQLLNREEAVLLDIRESAEFAAGHIVDALHIPHNKLAERLVELETHKSKIVVVADKMGQHAPTAGRLLRDKGFEVRRLQGGMGDWLAQALPVVKK